MLQEQEDSYSTNRNSTGFEGVTEEALKVVQQIFLLQSNEAPRVAVIAGVNDANGSSQVSIEIAEALSRSSSGSVCLLEANFRSPSLASRLGVKPRNGLVEALSQEGPIHSFASQVRDKNLWLVSSGKITQDSTNLLTGSRMAARVAELRRQFTFVVIDAPPLTQFADAIALGQLSDGLILVLEADATRREAAHRVTSNLRSANVPVLCGILNNRSFPIPGNIYNRL
jgi:receptor protein-tyrosine kinase